MTDDIYRERAHLVAFLATLFPSVSAYTDPAEPDWLVVYIDAPTGQLSWHISPADRDLFEHVPRVPANHPRAQWDKHTTAEKYERLAGMVPMIQRGGPADGPVPIRETRWGCPYCVSRYTTEAAAAKHIGHCPKRPGD